MKRVTLESFQSRSIKLQAMTFFLEMICILSLIVEEEKKMCHDTMINFSALMIKISQISVNMTKMCQKNCQT